VKQPDKSSEQHIDSSQSPQVQHPKRGAIPSPLSDIKKAPIFAPNQGTEVEQQTSSAVDRSVPESKG
jgi:hypothetical protein